MMNIFIINLIYSQRERGEQEEEYIINNESSYSEREMEDQSEEINAVENMLGTYFSEEVIHKTENKY